MEIRIDFGLIFVIVLLLGMWCHSHAQDTVVVSDIVRVYDGDTFYINVASWPTIVGENIGIRIRGIDTPELRTKCISEKEKGYKAKEVVLRIFKAAEKIELRNIQRGKYFRIVADVIVNDTINVAEEMIKSGLAVSYDGGTKTKNWCN